MSCLGGAGRCCDGRREPGGPVWRDGSQGEAQQLGLCYRNCFLLARKHGLRSIAFPAISCGVYGYPRDAAARIAVAECRMALRANPDLEQVLLVAFDESMAKVLRQALSAV